MMSNRTIFAFQIRNFLKLHTSITQRLGLRTLLSQAYQCEEAWSKRLESPLFKNIKMDQFFVEIDKKFGTKRLASGIDIDLFANSVQDPSQFDELEHLLYRFRMTKRSNEMMDSTICAVVRIFLKFKDYESLLRILIDQENYGIFPDEFLYNMLMDHFIEQKMYREAAQIAILMMLQEDFSNEIGSFLAVYSCHHFMKNHSLDELYPKEESENKEEEDEEEVLERVPFFRNPWFDDHFDLTEPRHLIGKTFFLAGRQMKDELLGKSFSLLGLGMYEKWDTALNLLKSLDKSEKPVFLSEAVEEFIKFMDTVPSEEMKQQFEDTFKEMEEKDQIKEGDFENHLNSKISDLSALEKRDIEKQEELFRLWEKLRQLTLHKQNLELDKQRRLEEIEKKKEYLFWKEKELFFFEKEDWILEEFKKAEEITEQIKAQKSQDETYVIPDISKGPMKKPTKYEKLIRVKKI